MDTRSATDAATDAAGDAAGDAATDVHGSAGVPDHRFCVTCGLPNPDYVPGAAHPLQRQTHVVCSECDTVATSYCHSYCHKCGCSYARR